MLRYVVVGNGVIENNHSHFIENSDCVIRFNVAEGHLGNSGVKTDMLFLANSVSSLNEFANSKDLEQSNSFQKAKSIVLPKHPDILKHRTHYNTVERVSSIFRRKRRSFSTQSYASDAVDYFGRLGKTVVFPSSAFFNQCCEVLGLPSTGPLKQYPSTGMMGVFYVLSVLASDEDSISVAGFHWQGHDMHLWAAERKWMMNSPRLNFLA